MGLVTLNILWSVLRPGTVIGLNMECWLGVGASTKYISLSLTLTLPTPNL